MNRINTKSIGFTLGILAISAFAMVVSPSMASAVAFVDGYHNPAPVYNTVIVSNPSPTISSINPSSSNLGVGAKTVTITGSGFIPSSIARVNGSNRPTTFIDSSHLLVQLNSSDMFLADGFYITVFNGPPDGGYSNASFFTIKNVSTPASSVNNSNNSNSNTASPDATQTQNAPVGNSNISGSNLASNAIFGTNGFFPSGLIQWILFAIIILVIVILVRKIAGSREKYDSAPMKHA